MNLLNYSTQDPAILTHNQKVTRLYRFVYFLKIHIAWPIFGAMPWLPNRATLRKIQSFHLRGYRPEKEGFHRNLRKAAEDFQILLTLDPNSVEYKELAGKYEDWLAKYYEPLAVIGTKLT